MINISISGNQLYIPVGTSIQIEINNSIFATNVIEGDIIFTFDLPAEPNDIIFQHARYVYVQRVKKYKCTIDIGGFRMGEGDLYLQKSTNLTYSCGVVINPYPDSFTERKLSENKYEGSVIISTNNNEHQGKWKNFLQNTLTEDSIFKFPLFADSKFYENSNPDFGYYLFPEETTPENNPAGYPASLNSTFDSNSLNERYYINRLFIDSFGRVIENYNDTNRGIRLFNRNDMNYPNSFTFAPAIQLTHILKNVIREAGYKTVGNFIESDDIKRIYSQSLRGMDGLITQFDHSSAFARIFTDPQVNYAISENEELILHFTNSEEEYVNYFFVDQSKNISLSVEINTFLPRNLLDEGINEFGEEYKEAVIFFIIPIGDEFPFLLEQTFNEDWNTGIGYMNEGIWSDFSYFFKIYTLEQLQQQIGYSGEGMYRFSFNFNEYLQNVKDYKLFFGKVRGIKTDEFGVTLLTEYRNIPITDDIAQYYNICNIFSNKLNIDEHVPDITNADFINIIHNTFGVAYFIDSTTKEIEFTFIKDILSAHKSLDLTPYLLNKETAIENMEDTGYSYSLKPIEEKDIDKTKLIPSVLTYYHLPNPVLNYGKICFVVNENQFRISQREGNDVNNWQFKWEPFTGNNSVIEWSTGSETEEIKPDLKIPNMSIVDQTTYYPNFVMQIESPGCSPLFSTENTGFEMHLINYIGKKTVQFDWGFSALYEFASPVCYDREGNIQHGLNLTAKGENSIGERFISPWLTLLAEHETITAQFLFPLYMVMKVIKLLRPENVKEQTRWAIVGNNRMLPKKMKFELTQGKEMVKSEINFALPKKFI